MDEKEKQERMKEHKLKKEGKEWEKTQVEGNKEINKDWKETRKNL